LPVGAVMGPTRDRQAVPIPGITVEEMPWFCTQLSLTALGDLQGIMTHGLGVKRDIDRWAVKVHEGLWGRLLDGAGSNDDYVREAVAGVQASGIGTGRGVFHA
jgi:hypothetical protein